MRARDEFKAKHQHHLVGVAELCCDPGVALTVELGPLYHLVTHGPFTHTGEEVE